MPSRTKYPHGHQKEGEGECQPGFARREPTAAGEPEEEEEAGRRFAQGDEEDFGEYIGGRKPAGDKCERRDKTTSCRYTAALEPALKTFGPKGNGNENDHFQGSGNEGRKKAA